jgi:CDP-2,3-bis-(O-geranylgeranyl)-sn-glycerol synthase
VLASFVFGRRLAAPVDGGARLRDGRRVFGASKTVRGLAASLLATGAAARAVGASVGEGALVAALAMGGDLFSSFVKRRQGAAPSDQRLGLDQVPEALAPTLYAARAFNLSAADVAAVVGLFFVVELAGSRLLYALAIKNRPY